MIELLTVLSPVLVAATTGLMTIVLAKVNVRVKKAEEQDKQIESIKQNQESISRNLDAIKELSKGHAMLTEENRRQGKGIMVLLRSAMYQEHSRLMKQGYITSHQLRDFEEAYDVYHQEGGNGTAQRWKEEIESLPVIDSFDVSEMSIDSFKGGSL